MLYDKEKTVSYYGYKRLFKYSFMELSKKCYTDTPVGVLVFRARTKKR